MTPEGQRPEIVKSSESIVITRGTLLTDNHSQLADELRGKHRDYKIAGLLYLLDACGDARTRFPKPEKYLTRKTIAAGSQIESKILTSAGIGFAVIASHFDGEIFVPGQMPTGCGGLGAKDMALKEKKPTPIRGLGYYIARKIDHPDPLIQALLSANKITKEAKKPSLAVAQNHRNSEVFPVGIFLPGQAPICDVNLIDLFSNYNPEEIYAKGIPELERRQIPDIFKDFLADCETQVKESLLNYPNLKEMFKVQNPRMIMLSSEVMSAKIRYPEIASFPGILFKIHLPRIKDGNNVFSIDPEKLEDVVNQTEYPIEHAIQNFRKQNESFSNTDIFLIETENLDLSKKVVLRLAEEEWMQKWMKLEGNQVLLVQTQEGISQLIEEFKIPVSA